MHTAEIVKKLEEGLAEVPAFDVHTHLVGGELGAKGLHDILLYHMVISDLYAAGCPAGARLTQYPGRPTEEEAHARIKEAVAYLPQIRNTSCYWLQRTILADLYRWKEPITADNWRELDAMIRERANDRAWHHAILDRAHIKRTCTELARRGKGEDDARLQYALEWGFFTRCQWGEFDTALWELERCWDKTPESPAPIGGESRPVPERTIRTLADVHAALDHYVSAIPYDRILSTATHLSTDIDYRLVSESQMEKALAARDHAGLAERDTYASFINEEFLTRLERYGPSIVFQFSFGAEPLPFETGSRLSQRTIAQVGEMISRHPKLRFQCFLSNRHANQSMCTLARELPNLSLCGYWWHNFFPDTIRQVMTERLEMLPVNKQVGFFSDAYCVEWAYGKAWLIRKLMARSLARMVERGQYTSVEAIDVARAILYETPQTLLGMVPRS